MKKYTTLFLIQFCISIIFFGACSKIDIQEIELPVVKTIEITNMMYNQVTVNCSIISNGGNNIIEQGVCWSLHPAPTTSDYFEKNKIGSTKDFSIDLANLQSNVKYYVRSYAVNSKGLTYGEEFSFTLWLNVPDKSVTDIDNNNYTTIRIGDQIWMQENLKVTHYRNGDAIPNITLQNDLEWLQTAAGAYCSYNDDRAMVDIYGYLYNGFAVTDKKGLCPNGWHIATKQELLTLINYLGGYDTAGNLLKASSDYWNDLNPITYNLSGFTALPGGMRLHGAPNKSYTAYWGINEQAYFATSDEYINNDIYHMWYANVTNLNWARVSDNTIKTCGQSVRCVKD